MAEESLVAPTHPGLLGIFGCSRVGAVEFCALVVEVGDTSYNRRGPSELSGYDKSSEFSHPLDISPLESFHLLREIGGFGLCGSPHLEGASECSFTFLVAAREM